MIYTLSAYETSAEQFFETMLQNKIDLLLDIRLKNNSQLCGFTKNNDLIYFTKKICKAEYIHELFFAPSPTLLERYTKHWADWETYSKEYEENLEKSNAHEYFISNYGKYNNICLLGTATKKRRSHSEVLKNYLERKGK